jgi:hypothetical protein
MHARSAPNASVQPPDRSQLRNCTRRLRPP